MIKHKPTHTRTCTHTHTEVAKVSGKQRAVYGCKSPPDDREVHAYRVQLLANLPLAAVFGS